MKTKEIDIWISKFGNREDLDLGIIHLNEAKDTLKAKLIVELPEKEITITESDLRGVLDKTRRNLYRNCLGGDTEQKIVDLLFKD